MKCEVSFMKMLVGFGFCDAGLSLCFSTNSFGGLVLKIWVLGITKIVMRFAR